MSSVEKTAFWFFGLPVFFFLALPYIVPYSASKINQNVFPAFREIEHTCQRELLYGDLSNRCRLALQLQSSCDDCPASVYHERLTAFGFTLPPLSAD